MKEKSTTILRWKSTKTKYAEDAYAELSHYIQKLHDHTPDPKKMAVFVVNAVAQTIEDPDELDKMLDFLSTYARRLKIS